MSDLKNRLEKYVTERRLIKRGDRLVLGLSGGADSICLLNILSDISKEWDLHVTAVHVHHGIRGEEADRDAAFARSAAEDRGVDFILRSVSVPKAAAENGLTIEEAARILRYSELDEIQRDISADRIVLAHHSDDQAETVLMNLFRGTGPDGLVGMRPESGNRIRPLLFATKAEIIQYLREEQIEYIEDSTNSDTDYTRNRIRNIWLPEIGRVFPDAANHIAAVAEDIGVWQTFIREKATEEYTFTDNRIPVTAYLRQTPAIRHEWLRKAVSAVVPGAKDVGRTHFKMIEELFTNPQTGRRISIPGECVARREYNYVIFEHKTYDARSKTEEYDIIELAVPGEAVMRSESGSVCYCAELVDFDTFNENKHSFFDENDYTKFIYYVKIRNGLCLRYPEEGDYFTINDRGDRKRLNRFFIDRKVPGDARHCVIIADGSHVVWVMDRLSFDYMVTDSTEKIVRITRRFDRKD